MVKFGLVNLFLLGIEYVATSTGLYRSCTALAIFSGIFELIFFEAVYFEFIFEKVWFGLDQQFGQTDKINGFWFALVKFSLVCLLHR